MYNLYYKAFYRNKKNYVKYLILYFILLLIFTITLISKFSIQLRIDNELNTLKNKKINIIVQESQEFQTINKLLENSKYVSFIVYNSFCTMKSDILIMNFYDINDNNYFSNKYIIYYGGDQLPKLSIDDIIFVKIDETTNNIGYSNNKLSRFLIENDYCENWSIDIYLKSYHDIDKVLKQLANHNIQASHTTENTEEINSYMKLGDLTSYLIMFEFVIFTLIIIYVIVQILCDYKKDIIFLKSIGYSNLKIYCLFLFQIVVTILLAFVIYLLAELICFCITFNKFKAIFLYKSNFLILPIFIILLISVIILSVYFLKIRKLSVKKMLGGLYEK